MYPDKFISDPKDIPDIEHWAIIVGDSVHIPGDERSRTNPGHGYPAEDRKFISYQLYLTEEKLLAAIRELESKTYCNKMNYKVVKVTPLKVNIKVDIGLG
jgi:hypothetical protein